MYSQSHPKRSGFRVRLCTVIFLIGATLVAAANPFDGELAEPRRLHDKGVEGDAKAVRQSIEIFEKWMAANPEDPKMEIARAYLGSSYTLLSRDLPIGPGKMDALKKGGVLMDAAVVNAPEDMRVRLIRAVNNLQLPSIFGRRQMAYADFAWLDKQTATRAAELDVAELQAVHYFVGKAMRQQKRHDQALKTWQQGIEIDKSTQLAGKMRAEISSL